MHLSRDITYVAVSKIFEISRLDYRILRRVARSTQLFTGRGNRISELELVMTAEAGRLPNTTHWLSKLHGDPYSSPHWRTTVALKAIAELVGGGPVEALGEHDGTAPFSPPWEYISAGDVYAPTLVYRRATDRLYIRSAAWVIERLPDSDDDSGW